MSRFTETDAAQIKLNLGQPLTLRERRLLGLAPPIKRKDGKLKKPQVKKEPDDYSCLVRPPYRYGTGTDGDVYGRIIALKRMPDGSLWDSLAQRREPIKEA